MYTVLLSDGRQFGPAPLETVVEWGREGRVPRDAQLIDEHGNATPVLDHPEVARVILAPPTVATGQPDPRDFERGPALIPAKNPHALIGYYAGVFSLVPLIGGLLGIVAIVLGILGLRAVRRSPRVRGTAHAVIAIVLGVIGLTISGLCLSGFLYPTFIDRL